MIEIINNKQKLIECFNILNNLIDEVDITFGKEGIYIKTIHPTKCCMIIINIKKHFFEKYEFDNDITYTVRMNELLKILKCTKQEKLIINNLPDVIEFNDGKKKFKLSYFFGNKDDREMPENTYNYNINIDTNEFFNTISEALQFDEIGCFIINDSLNLISNSHLVKGNFKLNVNKIDRVSEDENNVFFDLTYIEKIKNIKNISDNMSIKLSNDTPFYLYVENENVNIKFILASRSGGNE
jgi:DNA polymerase III sliding clamp (beta) subunit (PCNA family)